MDSKPPSELAALPPSLPGSPDPGQKDAYLGYIRYLRAVCGYETVYLIKGTMRSPHGPILPGESSAIGEREQDDSLYHTLGKQPGVQVLESISSTESPDPDEILREFIDVLVEMDGWSKAQRKTVEGTKDRHDLQDVGIDPTLLDLLFWMQNATALRAQLVCPTPQATMIPKPPPPGLAPQPVVKAIARFLLSHVAAGPQNLPSPKHGDPSPPSLPTGAYDTIRGIRQTYAAAVRTGAKSDCKNARAQMQSLVESLQSPKTGEPEPSQHLWWLDESGESGFLGHGPEDPLTRYFRTFKEPPYTLVTTEIPPDLIPPPHPLIPEVFTLPPSATGGIEGVSARILNWKSLAAE